MNLPPGPRSPTFVQMLHWIVRPFRFMEECARRQATFSRSASPASGSSSSRTPRRSRRFFTGDPDVFHSGEANALLASVVGPNSVLTLDCDAAPRAPTAFF